MKNNNIITSDVDIDIDMDESSEVWSFRNKEESVENNNKKELSTIERLTQKVNQTLINSSKNRNNIISDNDIKYFEEESKNLDFFKKSVEKELEIFESERKLQIMNKNKDKKNLMNLNMTLSELNLGKGVFVTKDDIIVNLPSNFLNNTNSDDIGNEYIISMNEIERLIPTDDYVAKLICLRKKIDNNKKYIVFLRYISIE